MTHAWLLLLVDPAEPLVCQVRPTQCQVTHYRHAAWKLEQIADMRRTPHHTGRTTFEGITWTEAHSVAVFDWKDDDVTLTFHGERLSEFHLVSVAAYLRQQADTPVLQTLVTQALTVFQQAHEERQAQAIAAAAAANGGSAGGPPHVDPSKVIILGR